MKLQKHNHFMQPIYRLMEKIVDGTQQVARLGTVQRDNFGTPLLGVYRVKRILYNTTWRS